MRILAIAPLYLPRLCGAELALHGVMRWLAERGHVVEVITTDGQGQRVIDGIRVHDRPLPDTVYPTMNNVGDIVRAFAPDVVLGQLGYSLWSVRIAREVGATSALYLHDDRVLPRLGRKRCLPDVAIHNTPVHRGDDPLVVHPPIYNAAEDWRGRLSASWNGEPEREYAAVLVNLIREKGVDTFYDVARAMPDRRFVGIRGGYGEQRESAPSNVDVVGPTPRIGDVFARARVLFAPSFNVVAHRPHETFCMAAIEAQSHGLPVIATDACELRHSLGAGAVFVAPRGNWNGPRISIGTGLKQPPVDQDSSGVHPHNPADWVESLRMLDDPVTYRMLSRAATANVARFDFDAEMRAVEDRLLMRRAA